MMMKLRKSGTAALALASATLLAAPISAQVQYRQKIAHDTSKCQVGKKGPAAWITINGVVESRGTLRIQSYRGVESDWLKKGKWINRIEVPAKAGQMSICMPLPESGTYAIAIRHDLNGNGNTDLREDGGGMSNNPSINIFNLGKPSYKKTAFTVNGGVKQLTINMRYW